MSGVLLVAGVVYVVVAAGIWRGNRVARIVVAVLTVFVLIGSAATLGEPGELWPSLVQIVIAVVILALLFQRPARDYFRRSSDGPQQ